MPLKFQCWAIIFTTLYRNHLPKFGKIFFQEELVQKLVSTLYPLNLDRNKLDVKVEKAQKMIVDLVIALFTNSVSLGCGSVVFKNVSDAIVGIMPPGGSSPIQQKNVFSLLVDSIQSFVRLTNLPWNWPVHLEYRLGSREYFKGSDLTSKIHETIKCCKIQIPKIRFVLFSKSEFFSTCRI